MFLKMFSWYVLERIHHKYHKFFYLVFFKRTNMRFGRKRKVEGRGEEVEERHPRARWVCPPDWMNIKFWSPANNHPSSPCFFGYDDWNMYPTWSQTFRQSAWPGTWREFGAWFSRKMYVIYISGQKRGRTCTLHQSSILRCICKSADKFQRDVRYVRTKTYLRRWLWNNHEAF